MIGIVSKRSPARRATRIVVLAVFPVFALSANDDLGQVKERELEEVRERISDLKKSMDRGAMQRDRVTKELQAAEIAIAEKRQRLKKIEHERDNSARKKADIDARIAETKAALDAESEQLATQLRASYMSGSDEKLKLFLNQQDPATLGRLMTYYDYLNQHRIGNIETVKGHMQELSKLQAEAAAEASRLAEIAERRYAELGKLNDAQERRRELLASLKQRLSDEAREIDRLAAQERDLARLIAELSSILADYPISSEQPFSEFKGRLTWPVAGTLLHDFGQPRVGDRLKWNGVVLGAPRGREVCSVYHGRIAFADWLAGLGLLVIVDHGEGYMTLYGYNETVLKDAGDWVAPGDVIATVGDSGGRPQTGLYFEIRKGTKPLNPGIWVTRRPGS